VVLGLAGIGAAPAPASAPTGLCIPILMDCGTGGAPTPSPTPSPSASADPGAGSGAGTGSGVPGGLGGLLGDGASSGSTPLGGAVGGLSGDGASDPGGPPPKAIPDKGVPTFTLPAAQLGGSSISFSGLKSVTFVTVPLIGGRSTRAIKLEADDIAIDDFVLDVGRATGTKAVTNASRMELRGNVAVYIDSLSATLADGSGISLLADTPLPGNELPHEFLRPTLGLIGVTADSISFTSNDLAIH
jgi:hypothetical protein